MKIKYLLLVGAICVLCFVLFSKEEKPDTTPESALKFGARKDMATEALQTNNNVQSSSLPNIVPHKGNDPITAILKKDPSKDRSIDQTYLDRMHTWLLSSRGKKDTAILTAEQKNKALHFYRSTTPYYWIRLINLKKGKPILFRSEEQSDVFNKLDLSSKKIFFQEGRIKLQNSLRYGIFCSLDVRIEEHSALNNQNSWLLSPIDNIEVIPKSSSGYSGVRIVFETQKAGGVLILDNISCYTPVADGEAYKDLTLLDLFFSLGINGVYTY